MIVRIDLCGKNKRENQVGDLGGGGDQGNNVEKPTALLLEQLVAMETN